MENENTSVEDVNPQAVPEAVEGEESLNQPDSTNQDTQEQGNAQELDPNLFDENGVPWKNRAMEWRRKAEDITTNLPKLIEENVSKLAQKPKEQEYTISQLEQFALQNPEHRPWVEEQKELIREKRLEERLRKEREEALNLQKTEMTKKQAEAQVLNEKAYADAFITVNGQKAFNPQSILVQTASQIMQDPALQSRPDAIAVAFELAYGRLARNGQLNKPNNLQSLKRETQVLKQRTLHEGGGNPAPAPKDDFSAAIDNLKATGSKRAQQAAVAAYFKKHRK